MCNSLKNRYLCRPTMSKTIFWQVLTLGFWPSQHRQRRRAHHRLLQYDGHNGCQSHRRRTSVRAPTTRHLHRPRQENHRPLNGPAATLRILRIALLSIINLFEGRAMCRYGVYGVYGVYAGLCAIYHKNILQEYLCNSLKNRTFADRLCPKQSFGRLWRVAFGRAGDCVCRN